MKTIALLAPMAIIIFLCSCANDMTSYTMQRYGPYDKDAFTAIFDKYIESGQTIESRHPATIGKERSLETGLLVFSQQKMYYIVWNNTDFKYYKLLAVPYTEIDSVFTWENEVFGLNPRVITVKHGDSTDNFVLSYPWTASPEDIMHYLENKTGKPTATPVGS